MIIPKVNFNVYFIIPEKYFCIFFLTKWKIFQIVYCSLCVIRNWIKSQCSSFVCFVVQHFYHKFLVINVLFLNEYQFMTLQATMKIPSGIEKTFGILQELFLEILVTRSTKKCLHAGHRYFITIDKVQGYSNISLNLRKNLEMFSCKSVSWTNEPLLLTKVALAKCVYFENPALLSKY